MSRTILAKSVCVFVPVNPGRFTLTPEVFVSGLKVGDVLKLKCSGSVGTLGIFTPVLLF